MVNGTFFKGILNSKYLILGAVFLLFSAGCVKSINVLGPGPDSRSSSDTGLPGDLTFVNCISNGTLTRSPADLVISPNNLYVYVALSASDGVAWFTVDQGTKALTYSGRLVDAALYNETMSLVISSNGSNVYITSRLSATVAWLNRNFSTGALTYVGHYSNETTIPNCSAICLSPNGSNAYVCTSYPYSNVAVFNRDVNTGALTFVTNYQDIKYQGGQTIKCSSDGAYVLVSCSAADSLCVFIRDAATGLLTYATRYYDTQYSDAMRNFCFSTDNKFIYGVGQYSNYITLLSNNGNSLSFVDMVSSTNDLADVYYVYATVDHVYACGRNAQKVNVYDRDGVTGKLTKQSEWMDFTQVQGPRCVKLSPDKTFAIVDGISNHSVASFKVKQ